MRVIVKKLDILSSKANLGKREFIFSKDKDLPIKRVLRAKKRVLLDRLGRNNPFVIGGLCVLFRF